MSDTLTYNFNPEDTVYVIIDCDADSEDIQQYPADGNILVKEGVVKEIKPSISADSQNADARMSVKVLNGVVSPTGSPAQMTVDVSGGAITAVTLVDGGSSYIDGTGFTFLLATTAGGGNGAGEITYDVVNGEVTNPSVSAPGSGYTDGVDRIVTDVPAQTGIDINFGGRGYFPDTAEASLTVDIVGGIVENVDIVDGGAQYADGTGFTFLLVATSGGGDGLAEITYDVVDGEITNAIVSAGGTTYNDGLDIAVDASDIPVSQNSFLLENTAGGGDGMASIGYKVSSGAIVDAEVLDGGTTYDDHSKVGVSTFDIPAANQKDHELLYSVKFSDNFKTFDIDVPVSAAGVEQQGDIFGTVSAAIAEYQTRI